MTGGGIPSVLVPPSPVAPHNRLYNRSAQLASPWSYIIQQFELLGGPESVPGGSLLGPRSAHDYLARHHPVCSSRISQEASPILSVSGPVITVRTTFLQPSPPPKELIILDQINFNTAVVIIIVDQEKHRLHISRQVYHSMCIYIQSKKVESCSNIPSQTLATQRVCVESRTRAVLAQAL